MESHRAQSKALDVCVGGRRCTERLKSLKMCTRRDHCERVWLPHRVLRCALCVEMSVSGAACKRRIGWRASCGGVDCVGEWCRHGKSQCTAGSKAAALDYRCECRECRQRCTVLEAQSNHWQLHRISQALLIGGIGVVVTTRAATLPIETYLSL